MKNKLKQVKQMIKELSSEDRQKLIPFLAEFSDSGLQSYDLREELETLKKFGTRLTGPDNDPDYYLVNLVFIRNLVSVQILDTEVLRAIFFPDNFIEVFPKSRGKISIASESFKRSLFTEEKKEAARSNRMTQGIQESDVEFEVFITETCDSIGELLVTEKAKRMAEQISLHLPGMVGDMFTAAIKGQAFADTIKLFDESDTSRQKPCVKEFKKMVLDAHWREVKPHLPITKNTRTNPAWRDEEKLKQYARRVNERKLLAACIKDMYENCEGEAGWIEDLKQDSNYQLLSKEIPSEVIAWVVKRVASEDLPSREREPLSIACEMARQELGQPEQSIETLRDYYGTGSKLLKKDRNQRS